MMEMMFSSLAIKCVTSCPMFAQLEGGKCNNSHWIPSHSPTPSGEETPLHSIDTGFIYMVGIAINAASLNIQKRLLAPMIIRSLVWFYGLFTLTCKLHTLSIPLRWDPRTSINDDQLQRFIYHPPTLPSIQPSSIIISTPMIRKLTFIMMIMMMIMIIG